MQIRPALVKDIDRFYELFREIMHEGYSGYPESLKSRFLEKEYSINNFYVWVEKFFRLVLLAEEQGEVVGYLVGDYTFGGVGFVSWIGVKKDKRGVGVGKQLFKNYESFAKTRNAHLIELYTYEKIIPFYENLGFKEIGRRQYGYFGQKNIIMNKKISDWNESNLDKI